MNSTETTILIFDESQVLYENQVFWDLVKTKIDNEKKPIYIIFFALYHGYDIKTNLTPFKFNRENIFHMNVLGLKPTEIPQLFD